MEAVRPTDTPPEVAARLGRPRRTQYAWSEVKIGEWQRWADLTGEPVTDGDAFRYTERIRTAANMWARDHGLKVETHRAGSGRTLDLRFTKRTNPAKPAIVSPER
jgi:hypothetical protein